MGRSGEFGVGITPPSRRAACSPTQTCSSTIRRRPRRCGAGCSPSSIGSTPEWRTSKQGPGSRPRRCRPASPYSPEECVEQKFSEVAPASGFCYLECKRSGGGRGKGADCMRRLVFVLTVIVAALFMTSGVALAVTKIGTDGPDTLRGTNGDDDLIGLGANDVLFTFKGRDNLVGGPGKDWVLGGNEVRALGGKKNLGGGSGNDAVFGGTGSDNVLGDSGNDDLGGGRGSDSVVGAQGRDIVDGDLGSDSLVGGEGPDWVVNGPLRETSKNTLSGGDGDDALISNNRPAKRDKVSCGGGYDRVVADTKDLVAADCERARRGFTPQKVIDELFVELGFVEVIEGTAPDPLE